MRKYNLAYYVYVENTNKRKIEKYNVLNDGIINEILERTKGFKDKKSFAEELERIILYHYWARSEWEIILTDWPTHIEVDELSRLTNDIKSHISKFDKLPYALSINLKTAEKIDAYDQVTMNWNIFLDYTWENLKGEL